jgi:hypothetical protein
MGWVAALASSSRHPYFRYGHHWRHALRYSPHAVDLLAQHAPDQARAFPDEAGAVKRIMLCYATANGVVVEADCLRGNAGAVAVGVAVGVGIACSQVRSRKTPKNARTLLGN